MFHITLFGRTNSLQNPNNFILRGKKYLKFPQIAGRYILGWNNRFACGNPSILIFEKQDLIWNLPSTRLESCSLFIPFPEFFLYFLFLVSLSYRQNAAWVSHAQFYSNLWPIISDLLWGNSTTEGKKVKFNSFYPVTMQL